MRRRAQRDFFGDFTFFAGARRCAFFEVSSARKIASPAKKSGLGGDG